jgi:hypothetical protein
LIVPILSGIYTDDAADMRVGLPVNLMPTVLDSGLSKGYLRPAEGFVSQGAGPGVSRGGINWPDAGGNDRLYRVMGTKLVQIDSAGIVSVLGDVGSGGQCTLDYSFDRLAICSGGRFYYWQPDITTLTQVTDPDLGGVIDFKWSDGYFVYTDGTSIIVTDLSDPTSINPIAYGSSELDPDPIVSIQKLRREIYAVNRFTIEVFQDVGTSATGGAFPFALVQGAYIMKGAVGTYAVCVFIETLAFVGSGRNEAPAVYLGVNATATKISTREIDTILATYTPAQLAQVRVEAKVAKGIQQLFVYCPDRVLVYDANASAIGGAPVWCVLTSTEAIDTYSAYVAKDHVWAFGRWNVGDAVNSNVGTTTDTAMTQWGNPIRWEFSTSIFYNESNGGQFHSLELQTLSGRVAIDADPKVGTQYSLDGWKWSQIRWINAPKFGDTVKNIKWFQQGWMRNWRIQKFHGTSETFLTIARLDAELEGLNV